MGDWFIENLADCFKARIIAINPAGGTLTVKPWPDYRGKFPSLSGVQVDENRHLCQINGINMRKLRFLFLKCFLIPM